MNKNLHMKNPLFVLSQYVLPHHMISRLTGYLAETRIGWLKNLLINAFIQRFQVDMRDAQIEQAEGYEHFNAFFTRALKEDAPVERRASRGAIPL